MSVVQFHNLSRNSRRDVPNQRWLRKHHVHSNWSIAVPADNVSHAKEDRQTRQILEGDHPHSINGQVWPFVMSRFARSNTACWGQTTHKSLRVPSPTRVKRMVQFVHFNHRISSLACRRSCRCGFLLSEPRKPTKGRRLLRTRHCCQACSALSGNLPHRRSMLQR